MAFHQKTMLKFGKTIRITLTMSQNMFHLKKKSNHSLNMMMTMKIHLKVHFSQDYHLKRI